MRDKTIRHKNERGQAAIELAMTLPFLIWMIYYLINGYYAMHTSHIGQKYAAMNLWQRVNLRSKFVMDDVANQLHRREYMAVQYQEPDGKLPLRKIVKGPIELNNIVGICR